MWKLFGVWSVAKRSHCMHLMLLQLPVLILGLMHTGLSKSLATLAGTASNTLVGALVPRNGILIQHQCGLIAS